MAPPLQVFQTGLQVVLRPLLWLALTCFAIAVIHGIYRDVHLYMAAPPASDTPASARPATKGGPTTDMRALAQLNLMGKAEAAAATAQPAQQYIPETRLKLVLRGAFTSTEPAQASALIAEKDKPSQRYFIDDVLPGGAMLAQVHSNHVTLSRNGRLEALYFPSVQPDSHNGSMQTVSETEPAQVPPQTIAGDTPNTASVLTASAATAAQSRAESIKQRLERLRAARRAAQ